MMRKDGRLCKGITTYGPNSVSVNIGRPTRQRRRAARLTFIEGYLDGRAGRIVNQTTIPIVGNDVRFLFANGEKEKYHAIDMILSMPRREKVQMADKAANSDGSLMTQRCDVPVAVEKAFVPLVHVLAFVDGQKPFAS